MNNLVNDLWYQPIYLTYNHPQAKNVRIAGELAGKLPKKLASYLGQKFNL